MHSQTAFTSSAATLRHYHVLVTEAICEDSFLVDIEHGDGL